MYFFSFVSFCRNHIPTYIHYIYRLYKYIYINYHTYYQQAFYLVVHTGSSEAHKYHLNYSAESYRFRDAPGLQVRGVVTWKVQFAEVHTGTFGGSSVCLP